MLKTARDTYNFVTSQINDYGFAVYIRGKRDTVSDLARAYIRAGEREGWHRTSSFVKVAEAGGDWYTLRDAEPVPILFVKTMQYTPVVMWNDGQLLANQRLYKVRPLDGVNPLALFAVMNSTLFACERFGSAKALGREAANDVEVFTARGLFVPDVRRLSGDDIAKLGEAARELFSRSATSMLEEPLERLGLAPANAYVRQTAICKEVWPVELQNVSRHRIDEVLLKSLGISSKKAAEVRERIYNELVEHSRKSRLLELEAQVNRRGIANSSAPTPREHAESIWAELMTEGEVSIMDVPGDFIDRSIATHMLQVPTARCATIEGRSVFGEDSGFVGRFGRRLVEFDTEEALEYAVLLANNGICGDVTVPTDPDTCRKVTNAIRDYLVLVKTRFQQKAADITSDDGVQAKIVHERMREIVKRRLV